MTDRLHLLLPLASSLLYVLGAVYLKRATGGGAGLWRSAFVSNWVSVLFFLPVLLLGGPGQPWFLLWQPLIVALLLVIGQCAVLWSLTCGDVSVATPIMGSKIIMVALFSTAIAGVAVPLHLWVAALLSTVAIGILSRNPGRQHHHLMLTVLGALLAAVAFALFDVLVMLWSPAWGAGRFVPLVMGLSAVLSFAFLPLFEGSLRSLPRSVRSLLLVGSVFVALQGLLLITTVAVFGDATAVNIVYSTRGLWSVLLVWWFGRQLGSAESRRGKHVMRWRLVGAGIMTVAVVSVFF